MTDLLLAVLKGKGGAPEPIHINTSDPRPLETLGRFDITNVWLALRHITSFLVALVRFPRADVYVPISQQTWAFVRDALFLLAARAARRPCYVHLHGGYFHEFYATAPWPLQVLIRSSLRDVHQAWVLTPSFLTQFDGLVPRARVHILENAVEDKVNLPMPRNGNAGELRVLYIGYLSREKGCFDLLDALEQLEGHEKEIQVRFVGEAPEATRNLIEERSETLAQRNVSVELTGPAAPHSRWKHYEWADVVVVPIRNRFEGQPLVLLEALAAGRPIVTTEVAGIVDTVGRDGSALVVPLGHPTEFAQALRALAESAELRQTLGENARNLYEARYRPNRFQDDLVGLLSLRESR
jgi:glycosyltransferase involved in cell wall biosynthesis